MKKQPLIERFQKLAGIKPLYEQDDEDLRLEPEDRATRADKMLSGEYEDEDYKDSESLSESL